MKSYQNGDVVIKLAELTSSVARVSLLEQMQGFDIWEDMAQPTVYATVYLYDAIGLLSSFPILGEETLTLSFETPGLAAPATYEFRVFEVTNVQQSDNRLGLAYTLRCVSHEHFENAATEIKQSWTGSLDELIPMVLGQYLRSEKNVVLDATKGIHTIVIPKWSPLETIDYARQMAVSVNRPSSSFCFFENQAGFYFKTIESLIEEGKQTIGTRSFIFSQNPTAIEDSLSYRSILEHEQISRLDSHDLISAGVLHAQVESFDLFTKKTETRNFTIGNMFPTFETPDDKAQMVQTASFQKQFDLSPVRFWYTKDSSKPEQYIDSQLVPRNAFKKLLNGNITRALVHGDSGMKAGDVIELRLPDIVGMTGAKPEDPLMSGNYIILRLRHIVTTGPKHEHQISFDAAKVGFRA